MKKNPTIPILMVLISVLIFAIIPTEAEGAIYEDTVRLHILAASDSDADQTVKLEIRNKILEKYGSRLSECKSKDEAEEVAKELKDSITSDCCLWLGEMGYGHALTLIL